MPMPFLLILRDPCGPQCLPGRPQLWRQQPQNARSFPDLMEPGIASPMHASGAWLIGYICGHQVSSLWVGVIRLDVLGQGERPELSTCKEWQGAAICGDASTTGEHACSSRNSLREEPSLVRD